MTGEIQVLISQEELSQRIKELGEKISEDYAGKEVHLICVLKGGVMFMSDLSKYISVPVTMDFMAVSSYGNETSSSGIVKIVKDLDESIENENVIIVEDIIDSGRTLSYLLQILKDRKPESIKICTLLDKPDRRIVDVEVDYVGFEIPDYYVLGFGLDFEQKYRNLPYIGKLVGIE
ncbi:MAG: hypoxanthine phosphoribosyltransferase [Firmicutes bacterium HGW-Firmicutes-3]|jgi:hypoxanthine phosphoribosyltransferase|nr:MAG: hypoxanthine phosphoribosyltransferase [Firmicutes bacterium HGW-Firmicutes-3]